MKQIDEDGKKAKVFEEITQIFDKRIQIEHE